MIQYVTTAQLRSFASKIELSEQRVLKEAASRNPSGSTFLSHSSKDDDLVIGAIKVLQGHGANVYVDRVDPEMPPSTNEQTANLLKMRIQASKRFVLLASSNSKDSRWVPWELGLADGYKGLSTIALFPASDKTTERSWASWEYLGLYHRIVWGNLEGHDQPLWMVLDEVKNTARALDQWLAG